MVRSWGPPWQLPALLHLLGLFSSPFPFPFILLLSAGVRHLLPKLQLRVWQWFPPLFSTSFTQSEFQDEKDLHGIEHRVRTNHCSNGPFFSKPSVGPSASGSHLRAPPSWPELARLPSLEALLTIPLANSWKHPVCSLSALRICTQELSYLESSSTFPRLRPISLPSHPNFNAPSSRKSSPVPRASQGALPLGFHDMWPAAGDTQPCTTHMQHSAWHTVGPQRYLLKDLKEVTGWGQVVTWALE